MKISNKIIPFLLTLLVYQTALASREDENDANSNSEIATINSLPSPENRPNPNSEVPPEDHFNHWISLAPKYPHWFWYHGHLYYQSHHQFYYLNESNQWVNDSEINSESLNEIFVRTGDNQYVHLSSVHALREESQPDPFAGATDSTEHLPGDVPVEIDPAAPGVSAPAQPATDPATPPPTPSNEVPAAPVAIGAPATDVAPSVSTREEEEVHSHGCCGFFCR